jgi:hypothetical protein
MGRIFISAGNSGYQRRERDSTGEAGNVTSALEIILLGEQIVAELLARGFEVLSVPENLSLKQRISWIDARSRPGDVAIETRADSLDNLGVRGVSVFYIANNAERKKHAELLVLALLRRVPHLSSQGAKPDTSIGVGSLDFCRHLAIPSLLMEIGFLTNPDDRILIQTRRRDIALGIADGVAAWSRAVSDTETENGEDTIYPAIDIHINNHAYPEKGILIDSNACIPIDLADRLGINLANKPTVRRVQYRGVVYVKAIELREYHVSVKWDRATGTLSLRSILQIYPNQINRIMGHGNSSEVQMIVFLNANNENALAQFPDLPKLYRQEASIEGVNYDIAFCQMCVETNFLRFGGDVKPSQNNFGNLGTVEGDVLGATFPSPQIGVRAHIQHLKAYASREPLVQELIDPRFGFVVRGIAPLVSGLSGRWSADLQYGDKIKATLRRFYESCELL